MIELKQHPLSAAFPAMSAEDFAALKADIQANGQREPVMVHEGMVLDGWHRYTACVELGIKPQQFNFPADKDPVAFVLSHNLHRRHLTPSQRAAAIVACTEFKAQGRPKKTGNVACLSEQPKVADLAKAAQVAPRLIQDAAVAKKAGLLDEVKDGTISASKAAEIARGKPEPKPKKESLKSAAAPQPPAVPDADELAEAQHTITELAAENEGLRDRIAVEAMEASEDEKTQAAETIRELRERVRLLEIEVEALKVSRDAYMRESSEKTSQINYWRKQARKAGAEA